MDLGALERRQTRTTTQPMRTAMEVASTAASSRFSKMMEASSLGDSDEELDRSIFPLMRADMRSRAEMEFEEDWESIGADDPEASRRWIPVTEGGSR